MSYVPRKVVAGAGVVLAVLLASSAAADPAPPGSAHPLSESTSCRSTEADRSEFGECFEVTTGLSRPPAVGQTAILTVEITSLVDPHAERASLSSAAEVAIQLPANVTWVSVPAGMGASATQRRSIAPGQHLSYHGTVKAIAAGPAEIQARVSTYGPGSGLGRGSDSVLFTIGATESGSKLGIDVPANPVGVPVPDSVRPTVGTRSSVRPPDPVGTPALTGTQSLTAVTACVKGFMFYLDNWNITLPAQNATVQVWDRGTFTDGIIAVGRTEADGSYNICFDNDDDGAFSGGRDPFVIIKTENTRWKVHGSDDNPYTVRVDGPNNVADGSTTNLGAVQPPATLNRAWHAFDEVNMAWNAVPHSGNGCWDPNDTICHPQILLRWTPTSSDGEFFCPQAGSGAPGQCPVGNQIHLKFNAPDGHTVLHELGHAYMWDVYEHQGPFTADCTGHQLGVALTQECAWMEGWGDWFALAITGAHGYVFEDGTFVELDDLTVHVWDRGDSTQGRVVGAMLDLTDWTSNGQVLGDAWDEFVGDRQNILAAFVDPNSVSNTFRQFWDRFRPTLPASTVDKALGAVYQNTIDYGFHAQMASRVALRRTGPIPPINLSMATHHPFWSVLSLVPENYNYDMQVYGPAGGFAMSSLAYDQDRPTPDFVAIDSNIRSQGTYDAVVYEPTAVDSESAYTVEFVDGDLTASAGVSTMFLGTNQNVDVRDVFLGAGDKIQITVKPTVPGQYPQVFLMASDPTVPSSSMQGRASAAIAGLTTSPTKTASTPQFTAPRDGWYGLVLVNKQPSIAGSYTVTITVIPSP